MNFQVKLIISLILAATTVFTGSVVLTDSSTETKEIINLTGHITTASTANINLYIENPVYYVNGEEKQIDANNKKIAPYLKNGHIYIPVRFLTEEFGGNIQWDAKTNTAVIKLGTNTLFSFTVNSDIISAEVKNEKNEIKMAAKAELYERRLYVPADSIELIFSKSIFYERGLIIITEDEELSKYEDTSEINALIEKFTGITNIGDKERLTELLGYDASNNIYYDGIEILEEGANIAVPAPTGMAAAEAADMETAAAPGADKAGAGDVDYDYSETNTQVKGVDEADIIKTDGQYIYYVRNQIIEIVKANADGSFEFMSSFKLTAENNDFNVNFNFNDIFVDGSRIIAIGGYYGNDGSYYTKAVVINAENKKSPVFERSVEVKGNYVTSRKIGNSVYFAATQYFFYRNGFDIMPVYCDTAESKSNEMVEIGYDRLRCFPIVDGNSFTSLVGFNIDRPDEEAFIETFLGCGDKIYMSEKALYIASINYGRYGNGNETVINKFAADDGKLVFVKSGSAPGTVLNQFSMDEYQSYFRIATTVYEYTNGYKEYNGLYVFDNTMQIVGQIDDIAPGEHIYSARFMGNRAFMVTFKTVDPLFAIDLSEPANPVILGALKIPGYSNYLHPYDENHLIGFGKDTVVDSYSNAFYTGMKISLFDVTDMTNPIEMFVETIGARGTDSELLYNHKALLFSKEKNLLAFPVTVYESNETAADGKMPEYGKFAFSGAYVYDIDLNNGFNLKGKVSHMNAQDILKSSDWGGNPDLYIQRLLTIRDTLYAASNEKLTSHKLQTLNIIDELVFKER